MRVRRVSVLMTVFNTEAYLLEAIDGVLNQTLADLELIIVDDASTDGSWPIISAAAARDGRIVALRNDSRGGASRALNVALAHAAGRYITRQDSDDVSLPTRLAEQVAFLEANPEIAAAGTFALAIDADGRPLGALEGPASNDDIQSALLDYMCFCGPTVMVRRAALENIGFNFDESLSGSEDYDLCLRLAEVGRLGMVSQRLYLYRQHASSVSHRQRYRQLLRKASALEKAMARRFGAVPPPGMLAKVARDYLRAAVTGHATGEAGLRECVAKAQALDSTLLDNTRLVKHVVTKYTPSSSVTEALDFTESLFEEVLPHTRRLARVRRQLVAALHVDEVFAGVKQGEAHKIREHLWPAVVENPAWLMNRGVLSLLIKQAFGRAPGGGGGGPAVKAGRPSF